MVPRSLYSVRGFIANRLAARVGIALLSTSFLLPPTLIFAQADPGLAHLKAEIERLAEIAGGVTGVGIIHLETGRQLYLHPDDPFPMASTYKVPIAVQLFTLIDTGQKNLGDMIEIRAVDLHPGSGTLTELFDDPGVILSLHNLIELMLLISDNSATDICLREAGGGKAVTDRMRALGLEGITVNRPTVELIGDWIGIHDLPPGGEITIEDFNHLSRQVDATERRRAGEAFDTDPQDTATPRDAAALLTRLWRGELLSAESTEQLLDIMRRCMTGQARLQGMLPPGTVVLHKTGTIGRTTNDIGLVELPGEAGHVVVAAFVKESPREVEAREHAIAQIARAVYDYFLFNPDTEY